MISNGLSSAEEIIFRRTLADSYLMKTTIQILDLEHNVIADASHMLLDGSVTAELVTVDKFSSDKDVDDESIGVQQTLNIELQDPQRSLGLDPASPGGAPVFLDRMIRAYVSIYCIGLLRWVDTPVFTGPVVKPDRDNDVVAVEAQSKELLAKGQADTTRTFSGNWVTVVRDLLKFTGEQDRFMDFPVEAGNVASKVYLKRPTQPWSRAWRTTAGRGRTLFYDGRGVARMTTKDTTVVFTFDGSMVTSQPQASLDGTDVVNGVRVIGPETWRDKTQYLPAANANSRERLGRFGVNRPLVVTVTDNDLTSIPATEARAKAELDERGRTNSDVTFDAHLVPGLEISDLVAVDAGGFNGNVRVNAFVKPLTVNDHMKVGYIDSTLTPVRSTVRRP